MPNKEKIIVSWSAGKDSALALHELMRIGIYEIVSLITTVTEEYERISMHGVRRILLERQADSLGLPLEQVYIAKNCSNDEYESKMRTVLLKYRDKGVSAIAFGDIFLEDLRRYREKNLALIGMKGIFPLWGKNARKLVGKILSLAFDAVVTCVDSQFLDKTFVGRKFDKQFLSALPATVDPCGENGEFHSFAYNGPIFRYCIEHRTGEIVLRDNRFYFCDLMPV
ncbi:MAG: diphthine--ammonia ligase [Desulfobacterales bacterium]|nr:diphthine--ammonia ligase [Desulfobacterales bacterium]